MYDRVKMNVRTLGGIIGVFPIDAGLDQILTWSSFFLFF